MEKELKMKLSLSFFFVKARQVYAFLFFLGMTKGENAERCVRGGLVLMKFWGMKVR